MELSLSCVKCMVPKLRYNLSWDTVTVCSQSKFCAGVAGTIGSI